MTRVRSVIWAASAPVRLAIVALIKLYRVTLSGWLGGQCRFYPSCSHYAEDAIMAHGVLRGVMLAGWRILRCNPFGKGGVDRVPSRVAAHDAVIQKASAA